MGVIRTTKSVKKILGVLQQEDNAVSVVDLVDQLRDYMNKTTVYRILERLESDGTIHSFVGQDGLKWYAKCHDCSSSKHEDRHPHFFCTECGSAKCLDVTVSLPNIPNLEITGMQMLVYGLCKKCTT